MPIHDTKSHTLQRIVEGYMGNLAASQRPTKVLGFCRDLGLSRSTFYLYFEGLDDLDHRFLPLYFEAVQRTRPPFTGYAQLHRYYVELVLVMQRQQRFFEALVTENGLASYQKRYFDLVTSQLVNTFSAEGEMPNPVFWRAHLEFGAGAIERYLKVGLHRFGPDLDALVDQLIEYLWGGYRRLADLSAGQCSPLADEMDLLLKKRASSHFGSAGGELQGSGVVPGSPRGRSGGILCPWP